jgi:hypothetical protein
VTLTVRVETSAWRAIEASLTPEAADRVVRATAFDIQADVARRIQTGPKTGRVYGPEVSFVARGNRGRQGPHLVRFTSRRKMHQASAPGESPATNLAALAASYRAKPVRRGVWRVGSPLVYAAPLEFGDRRGRLKARPHLRPAFKAARAVMRRRMRAMLGERG